MHCIFCEIATGERAASMVWEDDVCLAFMDIYPVRAGHVLVIPRRHAVLLTELEAVEQARVFEVATAVRAAARDVGWGAQGANLMLNDGAAANQHVRHVHVHVLPRQPGDSLRVWWAFARRMLNVFGSRDSRSGLDEQAARLRPGVRERLIGG